VSNASFEMQRHFFVMISTDDIALATYGCQIISIGVSIFTVFKMGPKAIANVWIRYTLIAFNLWSIVMQVLCFYFYNVNLIERTYSILWILQNLLLLGIALVNVWILELFRSLDSRIKLIHLKIMESFFCVLYLAFHVPCFLRLGSTGSWLEEEERFLGVTFTLICIVYFNVQPHYLTKMIKNYRMKKRRSRSTEPLRRMMAINVLVLIFDWSAIILFLIQMTVLKGTVTAHYLTQISISCVGVHLGCSVLVFISLRDLLLPKSEKEIAHNKAESLSSLTRPSVGISRTKHHQIGSITQ
jgi:hypothetical protein